MFQHVYFIPFLPPNLQFSSAKENKFDFLRKSHQKSTYNITFLRKKSAF